MKFFCGVIAVFVLLVSLAVVAYCVGENNYREKINSLWETDYTVQSGDSLWKIAYKFCPDYINRADYVDLVREKNNLYNTLQPGQKIKIYCD